MTPMSSDVGTDRWPGIKVNILPEDGAMLLDEG